MSLAPVFKWLGLSSVYAAGPDVWLIILARSTRMFAYSAPSLILALFFSALGISDIHIGLFMTLTLAGDVALSFLLTLVADRVGRRRILLLGASLMILSGTVFALAENFWLLLAAAVLGVISATGGDFGPFRAVEESTLSQLAGPTARPDVLAWYVTSASIGSATGTLVSGKVVEALVAREGWTLVDAYHAVFWGYVCMGLVNVAAALLLSDRCELVQGEEDSSAKNDTGEEAGAILLENQEHGNEEPPQPAALPTSGKKSYFASISTETRSIMYKLWFLLIVDSLADGMTSYSLTNYYIATKFHLAEAKLGYIISASFVLSSCSTVFAGPLSRWLGLINTMVFTHLPSSLAVLLFPLPSHLALTVVLFFVRTGLNNMDQAPRAAFIAAVVRPEERTAVMGITSMLRTLACTAGPTLTGGLAQSGRFWIAFVLAGSLRICYDLGLWALFVNAKLHKHEAKEVRAEEERGKGWV
jgi:MFS family permease